MKDPFSWHEDLNYTYPHWLYDYMTYQIYDAFDFEGIYFATCVFTAILGCSIYLVSERLTKNKILPLVLGISILYMITGYIAARAQLVTFILFMLELYFIEKLIETNKKRYSIGLIMLPILIANIHLAVFPFYFIVFLPYIAEYVWITYSNSVMLGTNKKRKLDKKITKLNNQIKEKNTSKDQKEKIDKKLIEYTLELDKLKKSSDKLKEKREVELKNAYKVTIVENKNVKTLIITMVIALFTGFLTPLGATPYTYLVNTVLGNTTQNISEHAPMILATEDAFIVFIVVLAAVLMFTKTKIRMSDGCMLLRIINLNSYF